MGKSDALEEGTWQVLLKLVAVVPRMVIVGLVRAILGTACKSVRLTSVFSVSNTSHMAFQSDSQDLKLMPVAGVGALCSSHRRSLLGSSGPRGAPSVDITPQEGASSSRALTEVLTGRKAKSFQGIMLH